MVAQRLNAVLDVNIAANALCCNSNCCSCCLSAGGFKVKLEDKKNKPIALGSISTKATRKVL